MSALEIALQDAGFLEQARTICNAQGVTLLEVLTHLFAARTSVAAVILSARKIYSRGCTSKKIGAIIKEKGGGG